MKSIAAWLLQVMVAFVCPLQATSAAPVAASAIRPDIAPFQQALEALDRAPGSAARLREVVTIAGTLLTRHGIQWQRAPDDEDILVIAAVRGRSTLNDLAHGLRRDVGGVELRFDPRALAEENAGALYDEDANHLLLSASEVETGVISDYLAHEIVHARNFHAFSRGVDNLFLGWISSPEGAPAFHSTYPHLFSIDELQAYARQARVNIHELRRGQGDREGTIEMLEAGRRLSAATAAASTAAAELAAAVSAAGASNRGFSEPRIVNGEPIVVTGFSAPAGTVYFHQERLPSRIANPPSAMRAVAELPDIRVDFIVPKAFTPNSASRSLLAFQHRAQLLADRSRGLMASFLELRELVLAGAFGKALDRSVRLQQLARRNPHPIEVVTNANPSSYACQLRFLHPVATDTAALAASIRAQWSPQLFRRFQHPVAEKLNRPEEIRRERDPA